MEASTRISFVGPPVAPCSRAPSTTHHPHNFLPYSPPKLSQAPPSFPSPPIPLPSRYTYTLPITPSLTLLPSDTTHWHLCLLRIQIIMAGSPSSSITISKPPPVTNVADPDPSAHHYHHHHHHHPNILINPSAAAYFTLLFPRADQHGPPTSCFNRSDRPCPSLPSVILSVD